MLVSADAGASWNEQTDAIPIESDAHVRLARNEHRVLARDGGIQRRLLPI